VGLNFPFSWVESPWTRVHLLDWQYDPQVAALFRDWMRNGTTMTTRFDQFYVGQMADDSDSNAAIYADKLNMNFAHGVFSSEPFV
jgi:hypothetical protein